MAGSSRHAKEVDAWFAKYENPKKDVVLRIREIVLAADPGIEETIKWQAPTFMYNGNLASFYPKSKEHASLMFHVGAKIGTVAEANKAKADIEKIVRAWCDWKAKP